MKNKEKKPLSKGKKIARNIGITFGSIFGVVILLIGTYVIYVIAYYHRIPDNQQLEINNNKKDILEINKEYSFTTLNVSFGAYSESYTFFLDEGYEHDGTKNVGTFGRAISFEDEIKNTNGCLDLISKLDSDFIAIQEIDKKSTRSYYIDQTAIFNEALKENYAETFAINFDTSFLPVPLNQPHGKAFSGLQTFSKYKISESIRKQYTVTDEFPTKYFDLDRCFVINRIPVSNKKDLILINSHMSAYDKGGQIRNKQVQELNLFMLDEYNKGNYIAVGGDFNHDLLINNPDYDFKYTKIHLDYENQFTQLQPDWISILFDEHGNSPFDKHFKIKAADNIPSVRGCDIPYEYNHTYVSTVDGFIISDNIEFISCETTKASSLTTDMFAFSDHQPTTIKFKLI